MSSVPSLTPVACRPTPDLLLVRHAHTAQVGSDAKQWPLSERGRAEAVRLAAWAGWRAVTYLVTSNEAKAMETGAIIAAMHPHLVVPPPVAAFAEVDRHGVFVADYEGAVAAFFAHPNASPHDWEPAAVARDRFAAAIDGVFAAYPDGTVAVVAHGLVLTLYLSTLANGPAATTENWRTVPFAAVACVRRLASGRHTLVHPFTRYDDL